MSLKEYELVKTHIQGITALSQLRLSQAILKRVHSSWQVYLFSVHITLLHQVSGVLLTPFNLYLKAKPEIYSVSQANTIPTIIEAMVLAGGFFTKLSQLLDPNQ